jgi:hypothetical protein
MLEMILATGAEISQRMPWIPRDCITQEKHKDVERLVQFYDLVSEFQLPNSPEINTLDLGIWHVDGV